VSFARPEDSVARQVDVNALVASLIEFRDPEWKTLGLRVQNRLTPSPALVLGAQGQMEQVFLNLLVHAEQCASASSAKTITIASSVFAGRVTVEINYSAAPIQPGDELTRDPFGENPAGESGALGLGVCRGIIQGHGGEIRFRSRSGTARFEVELPLAINAEEIAPAAEARKPACPLTVMLVDADPGGQRQLLSLLGTRGHRAVPVPSVEAVDLAQRLRFDAVLWGIRPGGARWSEFQERIRSLVPSFILLSDGYDAELARSLEENGGFLLCRPIKESELDDVLRKIEARVGNATTARPGR
jgi:CheY-like chemotaxis protein